MMSEVKLIQGDCIKEMQKLIDEGVEVDLVVTSPPYDNLRTYNDSLNWNFDIFKQVAIRESAYELMHPRARCNPTLFKEEDKEDKSMSVRIKKQPKEITLEEFKKGDEYEEVIIHIDKEKKEEIENKYGVNYYYTSRILLSDDEIQFKENYLTVECGNVPYAIISKIEVVEK